MKFQTIFLFNIYLSKEMEVNRINELAKQSKGEQEINKESRFMKFLKGLFSSGETEDLNYQQLKYTLYYIIQYV